MAAVFDVDAFTGSAKLIVLKKTRRPPAIRCGTGFAVAGKTESGNIVLKPNTADRCAESYRWEIDSATSEVRELPPGHAVIEVFRPPLGR